MSETLSTATQIPVSDVIPMLSARGSRNYPRFKELEKECVTHHGVEVWQEVFNFRIKPALDRESDRWLLIQWCSKGIVSVKDVGEQ
jgi:hypothetical protein